MATKTQRRRKPSQAAILKAFGTRLRSGAKASQVAGAAQALLRRVIDTHRESFFRALLPALGECTRGGWIGHIVEFPSGHTSHVYIDADFRRWRAAKGPDAPAEAEGRDALSFLAFMRPNLAHGENLMRILGWCALDALGAEP